MLDTVLSISITGSRGCHTTVYTGKGTRFTSKYFIRPSSNIPSHITTQIKAFSQLRKEPWLKKCCKTGGTSKTTTHKSTTSESSLWWLRWRISSTLKLFISIALKILASRARARTTYATRRQSTQLNKELGASWDTETSPTSPIRKFWKNWPRLTDKFWLNKRPIRKLTTWLRIKWCLRLRKWTVLRIHTCFTPLKISMLGTRTVTKTMRMLSQRTRQHKQWKNLLYLLKLRSSPRTTL